jgi:hypothetical protein
MATPKPRAARPIRAAGEAGSLDSIVNGSATAKVAVVAGGAVVATT